MATQGRTTQSEIFGTFLPIYTLLNFFALSALGVKRNRLKLMWKGHQYLAIGISIIISIIILIFKVFHYLSVNVILRFHFTDNIQMTYLFSNAHYVLDVICVQKFGREFFLKYLQIYENVDVLLGNPYNAVIKQKVRRITLHLVWTGIAVSFLDSLGWYLNYHWMVPALYSIEYVFFMLNVLVIIEMSSNIIQIEYRLKNMGDILQEFYLSSSNNTSRIQDVINEKNWFYYSEDIQRIQSLVSLKNHPNYNMKIVIFNRCYMLLSEQCDYVNRAFGFRIVINFLNQVLHMVNFANLFIRVLFGYFNHTRFYYISVMTTGGRFLYSVAVISCLLYRCEQTYKQSDRIVRLIDHLLMDKIISEEAVCVLSKFQRLLQNRPIEFHAHHFFKLRYPLLVSILSISVTYTIILLQSFP